MRLQQRPVGSGFPLDHLWKWVACLENGWPCCDHGHTSPEQAVICLRRRL